MENLNAEQVKKALEWAIEKEFCENCLCTAYGKSIVEFHKEILALINSQEQRIKELDEEKNKAFEKGAENLTRLEEAYLKLECENLKLSEENERLRAENEIKTQKRANIFEIGNAFKRGRTVGVRNMQERIKQYIDVGHYRSPTEICFSELDVANIIDQIAKELSEVRQNDR